jgi:hypothetical protein
MLALWGMPDGLPGGSDQDRLPFRDDLTAQLQGIRMSLFILMMRQKASKTLSSGSFKVLWVTIASEGAAFSRLGLSIAILYKATAIKLFQPSVASCGRST